MIKCGLDLLGNESVLNEAENCWTEKKTKQNINVEYLHQIITWNKKNSKYYTLFLGLWLTPQQVDTTDWTGKPGDLWETVTCALYVPTIFCIFFKMVCVASSSPLPSSVHTAALLHSQPLLSDYWHKINTGETLLLTACTTEKQWSFRSSLVLIQLKCSCWGSK